MAHYDGFVEAANAAEEVKVAHKSGATSSHFSPFNFYCTYEGTKLTTARFKAGNTKHENDNPVYSEANWLKAYHAKDIEFFRDRAGHALEHLIDEMRGQDDKDPGGNLGAVGWFVDVMAFVKKNDPAFYEAIQGKSPKQPGAQQSRMIDPATVKLVEGFESMDDLNAENKAWEKGYEHGLKGLGRDPISEPTQRQRRAYDNGYDYALLDYALLDKRLVGKSAK
jgi:hypothetical protein